LAVQVSFKKALRKALQNTAAVGKNKFNVLKLFRN